MPPWQGAAGSAVTPCNLGDPWDFCSEPGTSEASVGGGAAGSFPVPQQHMDHIPLREMYFVAYMQTSFKEAKLSSFPKLV